VRRFSPGASGAEKLCAHGAIGRGCLAAQVAPPVPFRGHVSARLAFHSQAILGAA